MNPDQPSRDEIEARLTALLLGELPDDEARLLRWTISQDAGLKKIYDRLQRTIGFVQAAAKNPAETPGEKNIPLKLSDERRKKLLAHFKTPCPQAPKELFWLKRIEMPHLVTALAAIAIIALLAALLLPSLATSKSRSVRARVLSEEKIAGLGAQIQAENNPSAAAPAAPAPVEVVQTPVVTTLPPEPVLAPPPPEIVLPQPNSTAEITLSPPPAAPQPPGTAAITLPVGGVLEGEWLPGTVAFDEANMRSSSALPSQNAGVVNGFGAGGGGRGGGGFGGFGGGGKSAAEMESPAAIANQNSPALAWDDSGKDRLLAENQPANYGADNRLVNQAETAGETFNFQTGNSAPPPVAAPPIGAFPGATAGVDFALDDAEQSAKPGYGLANDGYDFKNDVATVQKQIVSEERFYRNGVGEGDSDKVPVLGDLPAARRLAPTRERSVNAPVAAPAPVPSVTPNHSLDSFDNGINPPVVAASGALALNSENTFSGGTVVNVVNSGTLSGQGDSLNLGIEKPSDRDQDAFVFQTKDGDTQQEAAELKKMFQSGSSSIASPSSQSSALQQRAQNAATTIAGTGTVGSTSDNNGALGSANISVNPATHNVIIIADKETENQIRQVVANLDAPTSAAKPPGAIPANGPQNNYIQLASTNSFSDGSTVNGGKFYNGLTKEDASGLRYLLKTNQIVEDDRVVSKPSPLAPIPQPEILTRENAFSTFSMNVSDVSFKLAAASLEKGQMPDAASIRSEEFINAFDYRDPEAAAGQPVAFASERARDPFAQNRDLLRFSIKTAASGHAADRPLNLVLLLDVSGSMERADRVAIIREALRVLASQLHPQDTVSVVTFARTARLWADGVAGDKAGETLSQVGGITPEGGTNLEEAMRLAYETARRHYLANGINRVVLLTDGATNLGNVNAAALKQKVEAQRKQGIALDCFGIGWEDYNDDLLEQLSGNGDGRYAFLNSPEDAAKDFAAKLAGALQVAAQDVKVQVEFNPQRVISWRQIGYAKHQLTKEQFRDNSVLAAEIAAQEAGNALYTVETKPDGIGSIATVRVRYKIPGTDEVQEHSWEVPFDGNAPPLEKSSPAMRLAATASAFSEWLAASPFAQEVTTDQLLNYLSGVPAIYGADQRPKQLETMIREAKSLSGK